MKYLIILYDEKNPIATLDEDNGIQKGDRVLIEGKHYTVSYRLYDHSKKTVYIFVHHNWI